MAYLTEFNGDFIIAPPLSQEHLVEFISFTQKRHEDKDKPSPNCRWWINPFLPGRLGWNGNKQFHGYGKWLAYLLEHFFVPWGYTVTGQVWYQGQDPDDRGYLEVTDNQARRFEETLMYTEEPL
jgi:hypothetical protein